MSKTIEYDVNFIDNITISSLLVTNISAATLNISGTVTIPTNLVTTNLTTTNLTASNLATTNITSVNLVTTNLTASNLIATNITTGSQYIFNPATSGNTNYAVRAIANLTNSSRLGSFLGKDFGVANGLYTWYEHLSDSNTSNYVHYDFNGSNNILVMNGQGRVGINTTSPTDRLHVNGSLRVGTIITAPNLIVNNASIGTLVSTLVNTTNITSVNLVTTNISIGSLVSTLVNTTNLVTTNISTAELVTTDITSVNLVTTSASVGTLVATGNNNTLGSLFTIGGSVGINTTSPSSKLDIQNNGSVQINIQNVNALTASRLKLWAHDDKNSYIQSSGDLTFADIQQVAPRLTIATTGNVGVGTNVPSNTLHVNGDLRVTGLITTSNVIASNITSNNLVITNITANGVVSLRSTRGILIGTSTNIDNGRFISALDSGLANNSTRHIAFGQAAGTNNQAELGFNYIGSGNEANSLTLGFHGGERMRIQANGNVGIGRSSPAFKLDVFSPDGGDTMRIQNNNANGYATIRYEANGSTWYAGVGGTNTGGQSNKYYITGPNNAKFVGQTNGNWGINTDNPEYPLHVNGYAEKYFSYKYLSLAGVDNGAQTARYSIFASDRIVAQEFNAYSDCRIKENIQDIDDLSALNTLRLIQPKKYNYIDKISRGQTPVWGFIAQQVRSVLDYSTGIIKDYIPNIYDIADVTVIDNISYLKLKVKTTEGLISTTTGTEPIKIKLFVDDKNTVFEATLKEIIDESTFTINESLTQTKVFIYGIQVSDFHTLNKDAIYTINVAATQELDRELQKLNETTQQKYDDLQQKYIDIEQKYIDIEQKYIDIEQKYDEIIKLLNN